MIRYFSIIFLVFFLGGAGCSVNTASQKQNQNDYISPEKQQMMDAKENSGQVGGYPEAVPGQEMMTEKEKAREYNKKVFTGQILAGYYSPLLVFNKTDYDKAIAAGKLVLLYIDAEACASCKKEIKDVITAFDGIGDNGTVGFVAQIQDIENKALAVPQTKVFLKGKQVIKKWTEVWNAEQYKKEILLLTK